MKKCEIYRLDPVTKQTEPCPAEDCTVFKKRGREDG